MFEIRYCTSTNQFVEHNLTEVIVQNNPMKSLEHKTAQEQVHELWDNLVSFPISEAEDALKLLLSSISSLINADHGYWLSSIRLDDVDDTIDSLRGWRVGPAYFYKELPIDNEIYESAKRNMNAGDMNAISEVAIKHTERAGEFRSVLLRELVSPAFFDSIHYKIYYQSRNVTDALFISMPINQDLEMHFCFNRIGDVAQFNKQDVATAAYALRGLRWFYSQLALSHGLVIAEKPLTHTERKVMHLLLSELTEKQISDSLGQKSATTHNHVKSIYRKFNVNSRAALMALWLKRSF